MNSHSVQHAVSLLFTVVFTASLGTVQAQELTPIPDPAFSAADPRSPAYRVTREQSLSALEQSLKEAEKSDQEHQSVPPLKTAIDQFSAAMGTSGKVTPQQLNAFVQVLLAEELPPEPKHPERETAKNSLLSLLRLREADYVMPAHQRERWLEVIANYSRVTAAQRAVAHADVAKLNALTTWYSTYGQFSEGVADSSTESAARERVYYCDAQWHKAKAALLRLESQP